ncbi:MAG: pilus assembly protein PilP [Deltaproteobacteria bacterium]|nr:pilus assembly protein PilP [Deltaproteobacteria bacterium]MBZ0221242.1 pilus assembly protein PilP [Deltaproteobacteria bacterium]
MKRTLFIALAMFLPLLAASCSKTEEAVVDKAAKPAAKKEQAKAAETPVQTAGTESGGTADLRNPFQSHLIASRGIEGPARIKGPLECCELNSFKLMAVVVGSADSEGYALIQAPDSKRYVIRSGDTLGTREGKVMKFTSNAVVIREVSRDEAGKVRSSEDIELRLPEKTGA